MSFNTPQGRARSGQANARKGFWESGKRLMQGGLIALIWKTGGQAAVTYLGIVSSSIRDLTESARKGPDRVEIRITFFQPEAELRILQVLKAKHRDDNDIRFFVESPVMFEAIRPFLAALLTEPQSLPLGRYLAQPLSGSLHDVGIHPPAYSLVPGFSFQLRSLFPTEAQIEDLKLFVDDVDSVAVARQELKDNSRLDPSQADAVVDALTREIALIQGYVCHRAGYKRLLP